MCVKIRGLLQGVNMGVGLDLVRMQLVLSLENFSPGATNQILNGKHMFLENMDVPTGCYAKERFGNLTS